MGGVHDCRRARGIVSVEKVVAVEDVIAAEVVIATR